MRPATKKRKGRSLNERRPKAAALAQTPRDAQGHGPEEDAPPTTEEVIPAPTQAVCWAYHPTQIDPSNKFQPLASAVVRDTFQEMLLGDRTLYREQFGVVCRMNPAIAELVSRHTVSAYNMGRYERSRSLFGYNEDSDASDTEEEANEVGARGYCSFGRETCCDERWAQNHVRSTEFIMCVMQRWYNMHSHCFMLYALSCVMLATGTGGFVWNLLLSMRIVYNKQTIKESMVQIGRKIPERMFEGTSSSIGFCVSDNCAYMKKLTFQHAKTKGQFFETVNYLYFPVPCLRSGRLPELPSSGAQFLCLYCAERHTDAPSCSSCQVCGKTRGSRRSVRCTQSWTCTSRTRAVRSSMRSGPCSSSGTPTTCSCATRTTARAEATPGSCTSRRS